MLFFFFGVCVCVGQINAVQGNKQLVNNQTQKSQTPKNKMSACMYLEYLLVTMVIGWFEQHVNQSRLFQRVKE